MLMPDEPLSSQKLKVLVVESNYLISMHISDLLESYGYAVIGPVATVEDALESLAQDRPDAGILEMDLRGGDSAPVALALKRENIPFMLSSARTRQTVEPLDAFDGVINIGKPLEADRLLSAITALLPLPTLGP